MTILISYGHCGRRIAFTIDVTDIDPVWEIIKITEILMSTVNMEQRRVMQRRG
jgi:hypothetical protein